MYTKKAIIYCAILFLSLTPAYTQEFGQDEDLYGASLKQIVAIGDEAFELDKDYYTAMRCYQNALEIKPNDLEYMYKYAEAARLGKAYDIAEAYYTDLLYLRKNRTYPLTQFWLARIKQLLGKYEESIIHYEAFIATQIGNEKIESYYLDRAKKEKEACRWAKDEAQIQSNIEVKPIEGTLNTPNKESSVFVLGDTLFYTSWNYTQKEEITARPYPQVMYSVDGSPGTMLEDSKQKNYDVSNLTYNQKRTLKAFTQCDYLDEYSLEIQCKIYLQKRSDNGKWSNPEPLPQFIQQKEKTYTHPNFGSSLDQKQDYLYYVSDQDGGLGKLDIWTVEIRADGSYGLPQNLNSINTEEDDITPFFHTATQTLYYSTEGRRGLGGFDVFKATKDQSKNSWLESKNLGKPINSSLNEASFSLNKLGDKAYFASNRKGSNYLEKRFELCCEDLYTADFDFNVNLLLQTFDNGLLQNTRLEGATVQLFEKQLNDSLLLIDQLTNTFSNDFSFVVERGKTYLIKITREQYVSKAERISIAMDSPEPIERKILLEPLEFKLEVFVYDRAHNTSIEKVKIALLEAANEELVLPLEQSKGTDSKTIFSLEADKDYILSVSKKGYEQIPDRKVSTKSLDNSDTFKERIYLRSLPFTDFFPLTVYFDNDYPDVDSKSITTRMNYKDLIKLYLAKEEEYKFFFTEPMDDKQFMYSVKEYDSFFEEIEQSYSNLVAFADTLITFLAQGNSMTLQLQGYASPRADSNYNLNLSARRIHSVRLFFEQYRQGALKQYIYSGQLRFRQMPYGEVNPLVQDNISDRRNSIYSIEASRERRVDILKATFNSY